MTWRRCGQLAAQSRSARDPSDGGDDRGDAVNEPAVVVVNPEFVRRYGAQRPEAEWWLWFSSERSPYRIVYRKKQRRGWLALSSEPRLYNGVHDRYTNFGRINPDIAVFERRGSSKPDASR